MYYDRDYHGAPLTPRIKTCTCDRCKDREVPSWDITQFDNGDCICGDCLHDYLENVGGDFVEEYIEEHSREFLVDWWFNGLKDTLEDREFLELVSRVYLMESLRAKLLGDDWIEEEKVSYCQESEDYLEFVKGRIA